MPTPPARAMISVMTLRLSRMPLRAVLRAGDDEAVVVGDVVAGAGPGEDAPPGHELEVGEDVVEALLPVPARLVRGLHLGDRAGHPAPHLLRVVLDGLPGLVLEGVAVHEDLAPDAVQDRARRRQLDVPGAAGLLTDVILNGCHRSLPNGCWMSAAPDVARGRAAESVLAGPMPLNVRFVHILPLRVASSRATSGQSAPV